MIVLSPERMKKYDEYAISTWGIPSAVLMENAGRSTYRLMKEAYLRPGARVAVMAGRGNNGGDGFVIARYAHRDGFPTKVFLLGEPDSLKGDARRNMELYLSMGGAMVAVGDHIGKGGGRHKRERRDRGCHIRNGPHKRGDRRGGGRDRGDQPVRETCDRR